MIPTKRDDSLNRITNAYGCEFRYNREVTENYYKNYHDLCQCAICRNFYDNAELIPEDTRHFLEQFGIDIRKPIEQFSTTADKQNNKVDNTLYYAVHGTVTGSANQEIKIGDTCIEILIRGGSSPNTDISEPYFVLEIHDIWLPWTINESIEECLW